MLTTFFGVYPSRVGIERDVAISNKRLQRATTLAAYRNRVHDASTWCGVSPGERSDALGETGRAPARPEGAAGQNALSYPC